jgi:hypothetical protein
MKDVVWMIDNWKKLNGIYGHLNRDLKAEAQLKDILNFMELPPVHDSRLIPTIRISQ